MSVRKILTAALIVMFACGTSAWAQSTQGAPKARRTGTIVKWTAIGAAAGFGVGFLLGFRAYDDATFAEQKIMRSGVIGAAVGGVCGAFLGQSRARASEFRLRPPDRAWTAGTTGIRLHNSPPPPHRAFRSLFAPQPGFGK